MGRLKPSELQLPNLMRLIAGRLRRSLALGKRVNARASAGPSAEAMSSAIDGFCILCRPKLRGCIFEKECREDLQNVGELLQAARANSVPTSLVFLDLLEG